MTLVSDITKQIGKEDLPAFLKSLYMGDHLSHCLVEVVLNQVWPGRI
jgi:hypothetical protein